MPLLLNLDKIALLPIEADRLDLATCDHGCHNRTRLPCHHDGALVLLVGIPTFRQTPVVQLSASVHHTAQLLFSGLVGIQAVLDLFMHDACPLFQAPTKERLSFSNFNVGGPSGGLS